MPENRPAQLSQEALKDLKEITLAEFGEGISDAEIEEIGLRLLRLFDLLTSNPAPVTAEKPTLIEFKALKYIHHCIYHDMKRPTVRGIAEAIGVRSSRSGLKMLQNLLHKGYIHHTEEGGMGMREDLAGCDTKLV